MCAEGISLLRKGPPPLNFQFPEPRSLLQEAATFFEGYSAWRDFNAPRVREYGVAQLMESGGYTGCLVMKAWLGGKLLSVFAKFSLYRRAHRFLHESYVRATD